MDLSKIRKVARPQIVQLRLIWSFMTVSIAVYLIAAYAVIPTSATPLVSGLDDVAKNGLLIASVAAGLLSLGIFKWFSSDAYLEKRLEVTVLSEELVQQNATANFDPSLSTKSQSLTELERRLAGLPTALTAPLIVCYALNDSIAIFGLILAFSGVDSSVIVPFVVSALILNTVMVPRIDHILTRGRSFIRG